ncbi:hypothetical protein GP486_001496 [Trichoglossum hirsutum]|uniref:Uncharacterized protein n=1 Tax=Trichoglossum hirsutum TaxID=265104 RepID=A0A9P8RT00_9PEZI|nr:hypothetical protein GP486_001496 [Trichoglossum hirsutum]
MADTSNKNTPQDRQSPATGSGRSRRGGGTGPRRGRPGRGDTARGGHRGGRGRKDNARGREGRGAQGGGSGDLGRPGAGFPKLGSSRAETVGERGWAPQSVLESPPTKRDFRLGLLMLIQPSTRAPNRPRVLDNGYRNFGHQTAELSAVQMKELLQSGLLAVTRSADSKEEFVNNLATESGLSQRLKANVSPSLYSVSSTHLYPEIRYSLKLEKAVGTIYNVVYGHDGNRGIGFFKQVAGCLFKMQPGVEGENEGIAMEKNDFRGALSVATAALLRTLTLNQGAAVKAGFKEIVKQLCDCYHIDRDIASPAIRSAHENILKIKDILSDGDAISIYSTAASRSPTHQQRQAENAIPLHPLEPGVDLPGESSKCGPRHDNDHVHISEIKILPTVSEILSSRKEFLPTRQDFNSPSQHHKMGILRLLDAQFRLLREDTSGVLRDSIRLILENWDIFANNPDFRAKRRILRERSPTPARIYSGVKVQRVKYNLKGGLEVETEFDQVHRVRNLNFGKRQQWWRLSRELREGGPVLALIEWDGLDVKDMKLTFLLVAKRDICSRDREEQRSSEIQGVRDLTSDAKRAMITLRLASPT